MKLCISFGLMQDLCAVSAIYQYYQGWKQPFIQYVAYNN